MISHSAEYYKIDDNTRPFLIYRGNPICYNQLNTFADEFAKALTACGERVEVLDIQEENIHVLSKNIGKHFKAIIGFQTYLFTAAVLNPSGNLHDLITGPKFNIILDHPVNLKEYIFNSPKDCYLLTHDRNYVNFCNKYYKNIKKSFRLAPGGSLPADYPEKEKIYDISFIGTYNDYRNYLNMISSQEKGLRAITLRFLNIMAWHKDGLIVNKLLADETALKNIAENGYQKARTNHTWLQRASYFLQILKNITD